MKKISIFFLLVIIYFTSNAQPHIQWQKTYGGTDNDYTSTILQTFDGGFILGGFSRSDDGDISASNGLGDFWIVKIANSGAIEWEKSYGGSDDDQLYSIYQTTDSGYIVSGYVESNDSDVTGNHGNRDCWIIKLDKNGSLQKQKCFGGSDFEIAYSIIQTLDGGYVFGGYTNSNDGDLAPSAGAQDYWVVKLDTSLNMEWDKQFGGTATDESFSIQQTTDSGFVLAGYAYSGNGHVTGHRGGQDCWLVKINSIGTLQWQKSLGGTLSDNCAQVIQTNDGGFVIAASTSSNDSDVIGNHGGADQWIVKLDSTGSIQWKKTYGGTGSDGAHSIYQTPDGGFITAGYSTSNDGDVFGNNGDYDIWVVKLDSSGNIIWQKCMGGSAIESTSAILQTTDYGFIILGNANSNDGDVTGNHGGSDYWIVKLDSSANLDVQQNKNSVSDFNISPNPFSNSTLISFNLSSAQDLSIEVRDIQGRLIKNFSTEKLFNGPNKIIWDATNTSESKVDNGIYFVSIITEEICQTKKVELFRN